MPPWPLLAPETGWDEYGIQKPVVVDEPELLEEPLELPELELPELELVLEPEDEVLEEVLELDELEQSFRRTRIQFCRSNCLRSDRKKTVEPGRFTFNDDTSEEERNWSPGVTQEGPRLEAPSPVERRTDDRFER